MGFMLALLLFAPPQAAAVTLGEVVELTAAGVGDMVLVELIQMGNQVYELSPSRLRALKGQGVSDQVLLALLRSGRTPEAPAAGRRLHTSSDTAEVRCLGPGVVDCPGVPALAPVPMRLETTTAREGDPQPRGFEPLTALGFGGVAGFAVPVLPFSAPAPAAQAPVYWGWGGEKRPGSWNGHSER